MSAVANPPNAGLNPAGGPGPAVPSVRVPLQFVLTGVMALVAGTVILVRRPDLLATYHYNQYIIATTHLFVLGWITSIVMGAMYQLVPVALETRLHSERLARWHFPLHLIAVAGMVWMFWRWDMKQVAHFGSAYAAGVGLFVYNIGRTLWRVPRWNVVATAVLSALVWFCLTLGAGLAIAAGKCTYESAATLSPASAWGAVIHSLQAVARFATRFDQIAAMHAHAHLGVVGIFVMLIVGVSYKLLPMFMLSDVQRVWRARASVALLNLGLAGGFFAILLRSPLKQVFAAVIVLALILYGCEVAAIFQARKRRTLDWGLKYFLTAVGLLAPVSLLAMVLSLPGLPLNAFTGQLENLYGMAGILGVISFAIIGMLYKITPFLVWYASYSRHIGKARVPSLADLYSSALQVAGYWTYLGGLLVTGTGIVLSHALLCRAGAMLLLASLGILVVNLGLILRHLVKPRIEPLRVGPSKPLTPRPSTSNLGNPLPRLASNS